MGGFGGIGAHGPAVEVSDESIAPFLAQLTMSAYHTGWRYLSRYVGLAAKCQSGVIVRPANRCWRLVPRLQNWIHDYAA